MLLYGASVLPIANGRRGPGIGHILAVGGNSFSLSDEPEADKTPIKLTRTGQVRLRPLSCGRARDSPRVRGRGRVTLLTGEGHCFPGLVHAL